MHYYLNNDANSKVNALLNLLLSGSNPSM